MKIYIEKNALLRIAADNQYANAGKDESERVFWGRVFQFISEAPTARVASAEDYNDCRNELCFRCGEYRNRHNGACNGCRWLR